MCFKEIAVRLFFNTFLFNTNETRSRYVVATTDCVKIVSGILKQNLCYKLLEVQRKIKQSNRSASQVMMLRHMCNNLFLIYIDK